MRTSKLREEKGLPKLQPIVYDRAKPKRNEPCPCGSGVKFKKCHGAPPPPVPNIPQIYTTLRDTYTDDQKKAEQEFETQWGFTPSPAQLMLFVKGEQQELKDMILRGMVTIGAAPKFRYAVDKLNFLLTPKNKSLHSEEDQLAWESALAEYTENETHEPEPQEQR